MGEGVVRVRGCVGKGVGVGYWVVGSERCVWGGGYVSVCIVIGEIS